jgi:hypothetical protein
MSIYFFGCWNNPNNKNHDNHPIYTDVIGRINSEVKKFDRILILGDNYYPDKKKEKGKGKEKGKEKGTEKGKEKEKGTEKGTEEQKEIKVKEKKEKILDFKELNDGYSLFDPKIIKYILLGNHDIEDFNRNYKYNDQLCPCPLIEYNKKFNKQNITEMVDLCPIQPVKQIEQTEKNLYLIKLYRLLEGSKSMSIFCIDINLYDKQYNDNTIFNNSCYKYMFYLKTRIQLLTEMEFQLEHFLRKTINTDKRIYIASHYPLISRRLNTKDPQNNILRLDIQYEFIKKLFTLIKRVKNKDKKLININYLCADTHFYENSQIKLINDEFEIMINQYIVGTGGTTLDEPYRSTMDEIRIDTFIDDYTIGYKVIDTHKIYGFCKLEIASGNINFVPVLDPDSVP